MRTMKESCLDRLILFGEGSLRKAVSEFVAHYHKERRTKAWATDSSTPNRAISAVSESSDGISAWMEC